jgi:hypothetical protein
MDFELHMDCKYGECRDGMGSGIRFALHKKQKKVKPWVCILSNIGRGAME